MILHTRELISQGQILALWGLAAKLPNSDLNFAVDFWVLIFQGRSWRCGNHPHPHEKWGNPDLDGGNSAFSNRVLVKTNFEASKTLHLKAFQSLKKRLDQSTITKARFALSRSDQNSDHGEFEPPEFKSTVNPVEKRKLRPWSEFPPRQNSDHGPS